ncbi:MAG: LysR family transcriptional regulator [Gammaproteobacteria bacterium]|nr:LysR family transcriptional regulator [Gammaproteobacteria bacterium]
MQYRMDWRSVNFDWNRARAFLVTAEEGSLSAAARALGMTQPTLGRQVTALEKELGVILFERVGQGLVLTPSGLDLLEHVRAMGNAANQVSLTANGQTQDLEGNVCISASEVYSAYILPPIIAKLRQTEPKIQVEIVASNEASDLRRREADIALRNFEPTQPELIAKKIKEVSARFYATKKYLDRVGQPGSIEDLQQLDFIGFESPNMLINYLKEMGLNLSPRNFPIVTSSYLAHWELVKQDLGIGMMPEEIGDAEPLVLQVLPDFPPIVFPIWLTTHRELRTSRRVRIVFDLLAKEL